MGNELGPLPTLASLVAFLQQVAPAAFSFSRCKSQSYNIEPSVFVAVLSHLSAELLRYPKEKKPQTARTSLTHRAQPPAQGKGCIWISFSWAVTFFQDNAKSVLSVLFQRPIAGG